MRVRQIYRISNKSINVLNKINIYPHKANQFTIANGFIGLINGRRTIGRTTVAETRVAAAIVIPALVSETEITLGGTTRTLKMEKQTEPSKLHHVVHAVHV